MGVLPARTFQCDHCQIEIHRHHQANIIPIYSVSRITTSRNHKKMIFFVFYAFDILRVEYMHSTLRILRVDYTKNVECIIYGPTLIHSTL